MVPRPHKAEKEHTITKKFVISPNPFHLHLTSVIPPATAPASMAANRARHFAWRLPHVMAFSKRCRAACPPDESPAVSVLQAWQRTLGFCRRLVVGAVCVLFCPSRFLLLKGSARLAILVNGILKARPSAWFYFVGHHPGTLVRQVRYVIFDSEPA